MLSLNQSRNLDTQVFYEGDEPTMKLALWLPALKVYAISADLEDNEYLCLNHVDKKTFSNSHSLYFPLKHHNPHYVCVGTRLASLHLLCSLYSFTNLLFYIECWLQCEVISIMKTVSGLKYINKFMLSPSL